MNVLHVVNSLEIGGLEKFVVDLTNQITEVDHFVVCLTARGGYFYDISGECFYLDNPPGLTFSSILKIKKIIQKKSIDIVHTHNQGPQFYGSIAGKLAGKAVIHTKHGQNQVKSGRRYILDRISSFFTDKIVTVSNDSKEICVGRLNIPEEKVVTILNGVDINAYQCLKDRPQLNAAEPVVIGTVARLAPEKNHKCLLDACSKLSEQGVDFHLKIVGDGALMNELIAQSEKLGLQDKVCFEGIRTDIPSVMNEFDIFVLPSLTEGVSLTLLEAMACELPVIATAVGGTPEVVVDGETGWLVPSNDPVKLADAIVLCLSDPTHCAEIGRSARSRVVEFFSLEQVAQKYLYFYKAICK